MNYLQLKNEWSKALRRKQSIHEEKIRVSVKHGVVELDDHVENFYENWGAEQMANVRAIASEIKIETPCETNRSDDDMTRPDMMNHLEWKAASACESDGE